jgi:hypothetical protein
MDSKWRKSSRSGTTGDNCVEVRYVDGRVEVRDSKHPDGPVLSFEPAAWAAHVAMVRAGDLDL